MKALHRYILFFGLRLFLASAMLAWTGCQFLPLREPSVSGVYSANIDYMDATIVLRKDGTYTRTVHCPYDAPIKYIGANGSYSPDGGWFTSETGKWSQSGSRIELTADELKVDNDACGGNFLSATHHYYVIQEASEIRLATQYESQSVLFSSITIDAKLLSRTLQ